MSMSLPSKRMSMEDAFFLYFEKPHAPLHIGALQIFEGTVPLDKALEGMASRMHLIPRYRQRPVFPPLFTAHPTWEDDPNFSLERHLRVIDLAQPVTEERLDEVTSQVFTEPLPRDRPLWEIAVIQGLEGDRTAYISRVHHCLVDGVSGIELMLALMDVSPEPPLMTPQPWEPKPHPSRASSWLEAAVDFWTDSVIAIAEWQRRLVDPREALGVVSELASALRAGLSAAMQPAGPVMWNKMVSKERRFAFSTMSFQEVRGIRAELGGTVNDVVLTILSGALGRYLQEQGESVEEGTKLRLMIPVNVRKEDERGSMGNRVSMMLPQLPVGISDPIARLTAIREEIDRLRSAEQGASFDTLLKLGEATPAAFSVVAGAVGMLPGMINLVCTNVPGPLIPLYGTGHRLLASWPLLPLTGDLGLGVAITSYDKDLYWGITSDPTCVPHVERLREMVDDELRALREIAGVPASDLPDSQPAEHRHVLPDAATNGAQAFVGRGASPATIRARKAPTKATTTSANGNRRPVRRAASADRSGRS